MFGSLISGFKSGSEHLSGFKSVSEHLIKRKVLGIRPLKFVSIK